MDTNKILAKLEQDLSFFMISEACKDDPSKRGSSEMYKYKGLAITTNEKSKDVDKVAAIRIGSLEAHFKIDTGDKVFGSLAPDDERMVKIWMSQSETTSRFNTVFSKSDNNKREIAIIPFDLEEFYSKG